jgi:hypothetical protein
MTDKYESLTTTAHTFSQLLATTPPVTTLWWVEKKALYPCLSRMARDYLCIPGEFFFWDLDSIFNFIVS